MPMETMKKMYVDWLWCGNKNRGIGHKKDWEKFVRKEGWKKLNFDDHHFVVMDIKETKVLLKVI